jgi:hypothetical protein
LLQGGKRCEKHYGKSLGTLAVVGVAASNGLLVWVLMSQWRSGYLRKTLATWCCQIKKWLTTNSYLVQNADSKDFHDYNLQTKT